jgi:hypothetical protein
MRDLRTPFSITSSHGCPSDDLVDIRNDCSKRLTLSNPKPWVIKRNVRAPVMTPRLIRYVFNMTKKG